MKISNTNSESWRCKTSTPHSKKKLFYTLKSWMSIWCDSWHADYKSTVSVAPDEVSDLIPKLGKDFAGTLFFLGRWFSSYFLIDNMACIVIQIKAIYSKTHCHLSSFVVIDPLS